MSQSQCGRSASQPGYPSSAWRAFAPPSTCWAATPSPPAKAFPEPPCGGPGVSGISLGFPRLSRWGGRVGHVLLTRSPLYAPPKGGLNRSTCMC